MRTLVWFRGKELRISDHEPLAAALDGEVIPVFIVDPYFFAPDKARELPHRIQFLLESLESLRSNLRELGSELLFFDGRAIDLIPKLAEIYRVDRVVAQRWIEPLGTRRDEIIAQRLRVPFELFHGETLLPPGSLRTGGGTPYSVFTPFSRAHRATYSSLNPLQAPKTLPPLPSMLPRVPEQRDAPPTLESLGLQRNERLLRGGEKAARQRLAAFVRERLSGYERGRDDLASDGTSRLSQDLKFGTLSVRTVWRTAERAEPSAARDKFLSELLWREFAYSTLWDRPRLLERPFRSEFEQFPWAHTDAFWDAWVEGKTGYPVVDAAARQLLQEGYVHNRARMIAASFLTKHLLIHYGAGERHYLKYLTDGDWAINNMGWQWSAGCGVDAQPYFRVFNPTAQGEKFDAEGLYVKRYVPELSQLSPRYIHSPHRAPESELTRAGVKLGATYPRPIVEHEEARKRFLALAAANVRRTVPGI